MTWNEVLIEAVNLIFKIVTLIVIPMLYTKFSKKTDNEYLKYVLELSQTYFKKAVEMTQQTIVGSLKERGEFDPQAQYNAFMKAKDCYLAMLSDDMKQIIMKHVGDFDAYITTNIEANVLALKQ